MRGADFGAVTTLLGRGAPPPRQEWSALMNVLGIGDAQDVVA